jgi:hypothetical protein
LKNSVIKYLFLLSLIMIFGYYNKTQKVLSEQKNLEDNLNYSHPKIQRNVEKIKHLKNISSVNVQTPQESIQKSSLRESETKIEPKSESHFQSNLEINTKQLSPSSIKKNLNDLLEDSHETLETSFQLNESEIFTGSWRARDIKGDWFFLRSYLPAKRIFSPNSCVGFRSITPSKKVFIWEIAKNNVQFRYKLYPLPSMAEGSSFRKKSLIVELNPIRDSNNPEKWFLELRMDREFLLGELYYLKNNDFKHLKNLRFERTSSQEYHSCEQILNEEVLSSV